MAGRDVGQRIAANCVLRGQSAYRPSAGAASVPPIGAGHDVELRLISRPRVRYQDQSSLYRLRVALIYVLTLQTVQLAELPTYLLSVVSSQLLAIDIGSVSEYLTLNIALHDSL